MTERISAVERRLWRAWIVSVTLGELAGFTAPAIVGAATADARPAVLVPALLAAGAVEGVLLGWAQARVLHRVLAGLATGRFVAATAAAAVLAYAVGLVPSTFSDALGRIPLATVVALYVVLAGLLLASIGTAQWLVLRRVLPGSASWILTTAGAWAAGLLAFVAVTTPLWQPGQPVALVVGIGVVGGLVMAGVVAVLTGGALVRLLRRSAVQPRAAART